MIPIEAEAIVVDNIHVYIICPYCGLVHQHGSMRRSDLENYGHRSSHCFLHERNRKYLDRLADDKGYEIVTTPATIRKHGDTITKRDLKVWKDYQTQLRANLEKKWQDELDKEIDRCICEAINDIKKQNLRVRIFSIAVCARAINDKLDFKQPTVIKWLRSHGYEPSNGEWKLAENHNTVI
jgi:hypothetical protein